MLRYAVYGAAAGAVGKGARRLVGEDRATARLWHGVARQG